MPLRLRLFFSVLIVALLLIPATALYGELSSRSDIWWTPPPMAPSLSESQDRVEIYVRASRSAPCWRRGSCRLRTERGPVFWGPTRSASGSTIGTGFELRGSRCY